MMLELHNVTIGRLIINFSLTVSEGQLVNIAGPQGSGKTMLLRAIVGLTPIDGGHICIDGELMTMRSAPYFRRQIAYVPQRLTVPDDYEMDTSYVSLLRKAVETGKQLLVIDEPAEEPDAEEALAISQLLRQAVEQGAAVAAVNSPFTQNTVRL